MKTMADRLSADDREQFHWWWVWSEPAERDYRAHLHCDIDDGGGRDVDNGGIVKSWSVSCLRCGAFCHILGGGFHSRRPSFHPRPAFCPEHCRAISIVERCRAISTSGAPVRRRNRVAHIPTSAIEARFLSSQFIRHRQHRCSTCFLVSFLQLNVYMVCDMVQSGQDI